MTCFIPQSIYAVECQEDHFQDGRMTSTIYIGKWVHEPNATSHSPYCTCLVPREMGVRSKGGEKHNHDVCDSNSKSFTVSAYTNAINILKSKCGLILGN